MSEFKGKTVLVTGAGGGIGGTTARLFGEAGARVVVTDINAKAGEETAKAVTDAGGEGIFIGADISSQPAVDKLFDEIFSKVGRLDHAVNCAGIDPEILPDPEWDFDVYQKVMAVNVNSVFLCMRREIRHMREVAQGTIVNLSSNAGLQGVPTKPAYCASKHAVMGFTRSAGLQYGRMGVRINAICPGATRTQMIMPNIEKIPGGEAVMNTALPIKRMAEPIEMAKAILFLSSEAAAYMIGAALTFDGGLTAGMSPWEGN
jgi:NAD(P)-dependent dehydrogenase (short-subunit alcohol dehydrogenase family)